MKRKYSFLQYTATRLYAFSVAYSPDGTQIAHITNISGSFNLFTVPSGGGYPRQLTSFTDDTPRGFVWSPDGTQIAFHADHDGDEQHQLYQVDAIDGWPVQLTDNREAQHEVSGSSWSPDGRWLAYSANDRNPTEIDILLRDMHTGETRRLVSPGGLNYPGAWSPDGRSLNAIRLYGNTDYDTLLIDVVSGEVTNLTRHEGEIQFAPGPWAPDGSGFYMTTNSGREFSGLAFYNLATRSWDWVETPDHDVEGVVISRDGRRLVWSVNDGGASRLRGRDLTTGQPLALPDLPLGVVDSLDISPDGTRAAMLLTRPSEAVNLYEIDLQTGEARALGQSMIGGINKADFVEPELITYPSFDGRQIPAWLYRPQGDGPFPVLLSIHGGPEAQERPRYAYNGLYQYLLSRGFAVLAPNVRGSTGYGISYQKLIHRDWGGDELKDIEHAGLYLRSLSWIDSNRIAVFGGSFGGFATLSAVTRLPEYWALGVDLVGPANLITFTKSVPPHWRSMMKQWIGDADEDREMLVERSPITYVDQIRVPLLVIQGAKDPRVVKAESDQMVERIRANGGEVEYYVDENEGHGTTRRETSIRWMAMIAEYIEKHLMDEPALA